METNEMKHLSFLFQIKTRKNNILLLINQLFICNYKRFHPISIYTQISSCYDFKSSSYFYIYNNLLLCIILRLQSYLIKINSIPTCIRTLKLFLSCHANVSSRQPLFTCISAVQTIFWLSVFSRNCFENHSIQTFLILLHTLFFL